jgi:hypothetical protein
MSNVNVDGELYTSRMHRPQLHVERQSPFIPLIQRHEGSVFPRIVTVDNSF